MLSGIGEGQGYIFMERRLQGVLSLANLNLASSNLVKERGNSRCSLGMFLYPYTLLYLRDRSSIYIFGVGFWCCSFYEERAMGNLVAVHFAGWQGTQAFNYGIPSKKVRQFLKEN